MPRDIDPEIPQRVTYPVVAGEAAPRDWCRAIADDEPAVLVLPRANSRATVLPDADDLLGWSVLLLTAPAILAGTAGMVWYCIERLS